MKKFFRKYKKTIVISVFVFFVLVFIVPIIINWLYERPAAVSWLAMSWEAKDVLSFYGSLLGAAATIVALIATILFTREMQKEDRKLSVKPRLETKLCHYEDKLGTISEDDKLIFVDYSSSGTTSTEIIPKDIKNNFILLDRYKKTNESDITSLVAEMVLEQTQKVYVQQHFIVLYEIYNYGANNAIEVEFRINGDNVMPKFCISTKESKRFLLLLHEDLLADNTKDIKISLEYTDICSFGRYKQEEEFTFFKVDDKFESVQAFEFKLSSPIEIL